MRRWWCVAALVLTCASVALADNEPKPEQLPKLYHDTLIQLQAAQDRKAELAARVAELEKQLAAVNAQADDLRRQVAEFSEKTFFLRTYYSAWQQFVDTYPGLKAQWDEFLEAAPMAGPGQSLHWMDPQWPLSSRR